MSLWKIAWRSIQQRALASALTGLSMALGVALVAAVLVIHGVVDRSFRRGAQGYDLIVGPKGSSLQLVLNTVYHMSEPLGKIPDRLFEQVANRRFQLPEPDGRLLPRPVRAIPVCMGGNYQGFRVVGTRPEFFELEHHEGEHYEFVKSDAEDPNRNMEIGGYWEAVIGPSVAKATGKTVGDTIEPRHGFTEGEGEEHPPFTVVGIFAPTGTPNDDAVFINIEGFWRMHQHHEAEDEEEDGDGDEQAAAEAAKADAPENASPAPKAPEATQGPGDPSPKPAEKEHDHAPDREISAILLVLDDSDPGLVMNTPRAIADATGLQAVYPAVEISKLLDGIVGNIQWVLLILAILVVVVAGISILVSIYNSMNDRRHEIAVMRALGASRMTVGLVILMESILLSLGGGAVGLVLAHGLIGLLNPLIAEHTGVVVGALQFQASELWLIPTLVLGASIAGYLPAVVAYRTDVAKSLASSA